MEPQLLYIDYQKCVGCGTCEMVCSLVHEGLCIPALSRIRVVRNQVEGYNIPIACAFCEKPPCADVCPVGAILKNNMTGVVLIDDEKCIGCRQCVQACPFGHMNFHFNRGAAFKCDLCQGEPQCVKFCWTGAVNYQLFSLNIDKKRTAIAENRFHTD